MQSHYFDLEQAAHQFLAEEWHALSKRALTKRKKPARRARTDPNTAEYAVELSPVIAVLPGLIRLVSECHDQPISKFRPTIDRLIREQEFVDLGGDSIVDPHLNVHTEQYVELTIRVLERVRLEDHEKGEWSDAPATPQMFG